MMTCSSCGVKGTVAMFYRNGLDKEGQVAYRKDCKECYTSRRLTKPKIRAIKKFLSNAHHRTGEVVEMTVADWRDCLLWFGGACAYCGTKQSRAVKLAKDHIHPVVLGGRTTRQNIAPACEKCNGSKNGSLVDVWFPSRKFYSAARHEHLKAWTCEVNSNGRVRSNRGRPCSSTEGANASAYEVHPV